MKQDSWPVVLTVGHSTRPLAVQIIRDTHYARQCRKIRPARHDATLKTEGPNGTPRGVEREEKSLAKERWHCTGESTWRKPSGWDEADVGTVGNDAPVGVHGTSAMHINSICRTAVYVTRPYGGVGGGA